MATASSSLSFDDFMKQSGGAAVSPTGQPSFDDFMKEQSAPKPSPEVTSAINSAVASVPLPKPDYMQTEQTLLHPVPQRPTPVSPEAQQYERDLSAASQPKLSPRGIVAAGVEAATNPSLGAEATPGEEGLGSQTAQQIKDVETPGRRVKGALGLAGTALEAATPAMGPAIAEAPVNVARGFAEGYVAGKGAKKVAKASGADPELQGLIEQVGQLAPMVGESLIRPKTGIPRGEEEGRSASKEPPDARPQEQPAAQAVAQPSFDQFMKESDALRSSPAQVQTRESPVVERGESNQPQAGSSNLPEREAGGGAGESGISAPVREEEAQRPVPEVANVTERPRTSANVTNAKPHTDAKDVILARHGETALDQKGAKDTVAGWTAEPLDERGKKSAEEMAGELKDHPVSHIVTSDLERAKQTADIVGEKLDLPVEEDSRLRPQHTPETEGLQMSEAKPIHDYYVEHPDERPDGGETYNETLARQRAAIADAKQDTPEGQKPVVLTHSRNIEAELGKTPEPGGVVESGALEGEVQSPRAQLGAVKEELRGQYPHTSEDKLNEMAREQLAFEQKNPPLLGKEREVPAEPPAKPLTRIEQARAVDQARESRPKRITKEEVNAKPWEYTPHQYQGAHGVHEPWSGEISNVQHAGLSGRGKDQYEAKRRAEWQASADIKREWREKVVAAHDRGEFDPQADGVSNEAAQAVFGAKADREKASKEAAINKASAENRITGPSDVEIGDRVYDVMLGRYGTITKKFKTSVQFKDESGNTHTSPARRLQWKKYDDMKAAAGKGESVKPVHQAPPQTSGDKFNPESKSQSEKEPRDKDLERSAAYKPPEGGILHVRPVPSSFWKADKPSYSLLHISDGTRGGTTTGNWDEIVARADKENLRMGEAERDRVARIEKQRAPGTDEYEKMRARVAELEAQAKPSEDQQTFRDGVVMENGRVGKDAHDYGRVTSGIANLLQSKGIKASLDKRYWKSVGGSPLYWELTDLFHNPLASMNPKMAVENITHAMDSVLPKEAPKIDERGYKFKNSFDMGHPLSSMEKDLAKGGTFEQELATAESGAEKMRRKAEIVSALLGETENTKKARAAADALEGEAESLRERAQGRIAEVKEAEAKTAQELKERPYTLAKQIQPMENATWTVKKAWIRNMVKAGEKTPWISDGHSAINTDLLPRKAANMAGERKFTSAKVEKLTAQDQLNPGIITAANMQLTLDRATKKSNTPGTVIGYLPADVLGEKHPTTAYIENNVSKQVIPVNAGILKMIQDVVKPDSIKVGDNSSAVAFYKGKDLAAVIMPLRTEPGVDIPTAKKVLSGEIKPDEPRIVPGARSASTGNETKTTSIQDLTDSIRRQVPEQRPLKDRLNRGADIGEKIESAKDSFSRTYARIKGAASALWDAYTRPPKWEDYEDATGKWTGADQINARDLQSFTDAIKRAVPEKLKREAISNWIEAGGDDNLLQERAAKSKAPYQKGYQAALKLSDAEKTIARNVMNRNDSTLEEAQKAGILQQGVENYVRHVYSDNPKMQAKVNAEMNFASLKTNPSFTKERKIPTYFDAEQLGFTPKDKDVGYLTAIHERSFREALAARAYIRALMEGEASDQRPLVMTSWSSAKELEPREGEASSAYLIKPNIKAEEEFADYRRIDHPALRGWRWAGKTDAGEPIFVQGDALVHPEIYAKLKNNLGRSAIRAAEMTLAGHTFHPGAAVLNVSSQIKHAILSFSGFHQTTLGMHAAEHRTLPAGMPDLDLGEPNQRKLVDHGLMVAQYDAEEAFGEGVASGGLVTKVPGIGPLYGRYTNYLFHDYLPRVKMATALNALDRNFERYSGKLKDGKITEDQIYRITAEQANAAFGGLNYRMLGRNKTMQDVLRLTLMAPDFFEARTRYAGQAAKPYGREQTVALVGGAVVLYTLARLMNQAVDGDPHWAKPFTIDHKGREYSIRNIQEDIFKMVTEPGKYFMARLSPLVSTSIHLGEGRNQYGRKQTPTQAAKDAARNQVPIPLQPWVRKSHDTNAQKAIETIGKMVGVNVSKENPAGERKRLH